jgi:hypothetical protein
MSLIAFLSLGACTSPDTLDTGSCGPSAPCPVGFTCELTTQMCQRTGGGPADAGLADAPGAPDTGAPDAAPPGDAPRLDATPDSAVAPPPPPDATLGPLTVAFLSGTTPDDGARTNVAAAHVVFGFTDPAAAAAGAHLECSVQNNAFVACTSPVDLTVPVATGNDAFVFAVHGARPDGSVGPLIVRRWVLDTVKPVVVIDGTPTDGSVTRSTDTAFVLAFAPPEPADSVIECSRAGVTGTFSVAACANLTGLADGIHRLAARGRDAAGNVGDPALVTWTVDATAPAVALGGTPADGSVTHDTTTSLTFAFVGDVPGGVLECKLDGPGTSEDFAVARCANRTQLADGAWTFSLRGQDAAGNQSAVASVAWTVDTAGPLVAFGPCTPDDGAVTDSGLVSYTWDFVDAADRAGGHLELSLDGVTFLPSDGTFMTTLTQDGLFRFTARGVDAAGNPGPTIQRSFTLSTVAPAMTIGGTPVDGGFLSVASPSFTFTSIAGASFECSIDGAAFAGCTAGSVNATTFADGAHTLAARARIGQGPAGDAQSVHFTVDTTAPVTTLTSAIPADGAVSNATTWTIQFTVDDATASATCVWDGAPEACTSPANHTFNTDGAHTVFVSATDPAGNAGTPTDTISYTLDTQAPHVIFDLVPPNGTISFTITFHSDKSNVQFLGCGADGGTARITSCVTNPDKMSGKSTGTVTSGLDEHHFTVDVFDQAGNVGVGEYVWLR